MEQHELLAHVCRLLERLGVRYMVTGSQATIAYGEPRFTNDIDIVADLNLANCDAFCEGFPPGEYYLSHAAAREAVAHRGMFNVIHQETAFKADCVLKKSTEFQRNVFERREKTDFYGKEIWIISKDDLIISKLWWAKDSVSEKQLTDVKNLMRNGFDSEYIKSWTAKLDITDLFERCLSEI